MSFWNLFRKKEKADAHSSAGFVPVPGSSRNESTELDAPSPSGADTGSATTSSSDGGSVGGGDGGGA